MAFDKQGLEGGAQEFDDHNPMVAFDAISVPCRDTDYTLAEEAYLLPGFARRSWTRIARADPSF